MMAISCLIMANLPTYAQIGIAAAWGVTLCRIIQGLSALGEIIGADLYLTEITDPPERYPIVSLIGCASSFGGMAALGAASLFIAYALDWRLAFWFGALIALVGGAARTRLKETIEFSDMKRRMKKVLMEEAQTHEKGLAEYQDLTRKSSPIWGGEGQGQNSFGIFSHCLLISACFYFSYVYCGNLLKSQFGYTSEQVIHQNLLLLSFSCLPFVSPLILATESILLKL
jgi:MHS family proline/betaine transporter-like MFS transporter